MTIHDDLTSMEDLIPVRTPQAILAAIQAAGSVESRQAIPARGQADKTSWRPANPAARTVHFVVPGNPQGKGRPRATARGRFVRMYTPAKTVTYESTVALFASQAMAGVAPITGPVSVVMHMRHPVPNSWSKRKQTAALANDLLPTGKPDMDNCVKALFDAMNGIVWIDDVQVVDLTVSKRYGAVPGVEVHVTELEAAR